MTPIAVRSDSDLGGVDASEDAAFVNEYGAEGTSRDDQVVPDGCICLDHFDRCQGCQDDDGISDTSFDGDGDGGDGGSSSGSRHVFPDGCICVDHFNRCQGCQVDDCPSDLDDDPGGGDDPGSGKGGGPLDS